MYSLKEDLNLIRNQTKTNFSDWAFKKNNIDINLSFNQYIYAKFINTPFQTNDLKIAIYIS